MARQIFTTEEYRAFAETLRSAIRERHLTVTAAAKVLGVTRQCLHLYLMPDAVHQPRWRVIERACRAWDISFVRQGQQFDKRAFETGKPLRAQGSAVQLLLLPEAIEHLEDGDLELRIVRKEPTRICLELHVKFAS